MNPESRTQGRPELRDEKESVRRFWNKASCGEQLYLHGMRKEDFDRQREKRYSLEPIPKFADFAAFRGRRTLEVGVGLGADHQSLAEAGADLYGVDFTDRAIDFTSRRFSCFGLKSSLSVADAEALPFADAYFDRVYSWGCLHLTPDTPLACRELMRVLKPGGAAKVMIYHKHSLVGFMLWVRYALMTFRPWLSFEYIYRHYLESPGTKAYTYDEARALFPGAVSIEISSPLTHSDLLTSESGQRHRGVVLRIAKALWHRWILRWLFPNQGLGLLLTIRK